MEKENRKYKDSVFVDLFYSDETAKRNLLSLYNALHNTDFTDEGIIKKVKLEDVLYMNFKNDISFEVNGQVFVFGEHQSTINPNMPLRCLLYAGRAYEQILKEEDRYKKSLVKIPTPEFYTFYNGEEEYPMEVDLRLSDAFITNPRANSLELVVKVININHHQSHSILEKCGVLDEYSRFVESVRVHKKNESSLKKAIKECINNGILSEYLRRKGSEVINMLVAEYSYEKDMKVTKEEGRQEGRQDGINLVQKVFDLNRSNPEMSVYEISRKLNADIDEVRKILKMFQ